MPGHDPSIKVFSDHEARAYLAAIVDSSDESIMSTTLDGIVTSWNRGAERLYGYAADEMIGRQVRTVVPADRLDELDRITETIRRGERVERLQTVRITKDGRRIDVSLTISPILAGDGALIGISVIGRDNSVEVRRERELRESEKRYRTLVEMARDAVVVHQEGRFVYANCAALGIYGARSLEQLQQVTLTDLVHPDEREEVAGKIRQLLDGEEIPLREYRLLRLDGREVDIEASSTLIDYHGRPSIQIIARDITERKRLEQDRETMLRELTFERSRFETVVRQLPVGLLIVEAPSGKLIYDNDYSRHIFRQEPARTESVADFGQWKIRSLDGKPLPLDQYPLARALRGEVLDDEEFQIVRGDGTLGFVRGNAAPIIGAGGEITAAITIFNDITERKVALRDLAASEERLNLALEAAGMGSCDIELPSGRGIWSKRHFLLFGYDPPEGEAGEASMDMWQNRIHPDDRAKVREAVARARREKTHLRSEHRIVRADNEQVVWVNVMGRFLCEQNGEICRFIGVVFDVSERKAAEEALQRSERRFRVMADSMPQIVWTADERGVVDYVNAHFETFTGISWESERLRASLGDPARLTMLTLHPDDAAEATESWRRAVATGESYQSEYRIRRADGAYHWHLNRAIPERAEDGRVVKWYGTATDINDLRETQEKLRASEAKFRGLYESNMIAIFFWSMDGRLIEANRAFCDLIGRCEEECRDGRVNWREITPEEYQQRDLEAWEEVVARGICRPYEKSFMNVRENREVPVLIAGAITPGDQAGGMAFVVDLTELKRAELALKRSEATLKLAVETAALGIFEWDVLSGKHEWSEIAKEHHGLPPDAEVDHELFRHGLYPDDREQVEQAISDSLRPEGSGVFSAEYRTIGEMDGKIRWLTARGRVLFDDSGIPRRMVGACLDITHIVEAEKALKEEIAERLRAVEELRRQEQLLIRQGRLAAMGEMIGNIAHQWRQPLNTLGLIVQELPRFYEKNLFSKEYLDGSVARAMQVINYMSKTIDGFRNFFGPDKEKESFRAGEVLARTVSIVEAAFAELNLAIETSVDQEAEIYGYPNEFSQVILNILVNAKDAILERNVSHPRVVVRLFREDDKTVLTIADNGGGIAPEIIEKIFDPYFSTKGPDKGTGIGLFMSKTIIEKNMNGSLTVRNTAEGAEFRIEV